MRFLRFGSLLAIVLAALARPLFAQDTSATHREAVRQLMTVTHVQELTEQSVDAMMKGQLQAMPQLAPFASILETFYREQMAWTTLEPEYTQLYLEVFTEAEIREMIAFYQTPLGQKLLTKMPVLMTKSNELMSRRLQTAMPQLMQRLQAAMEKRPPSSDTSRTRTP
jgi:hypothetical protein